MELKKRVHRTFRRSVPPGILLGAILTAVVWPSTMSQAQNFQPIANWRYLPLQEDFIKETEELIASDNAVEAIEKAVAQRNKRRGTSEEGEARTVIAEACLKLGLKGCAFQYALSTAQDFPGSMPSLRALTQLESLVKSFPFVEKDIQKLVNAGSFKDVPETLIPMVSYYVVQGNLQKTLTPWVESSLKRMGTGNYWKWRWEYTLALEEARRKTAADGVRRLEALIAETSEEARLNAQIKWQTARLKFELTEYESALKLYEELPLEGRQSGVVLRERAWTHFARKEYAEALGLLQSLKAPAFQQSLDPDVFFLEMLALRSLCHFESVRKPAADFRKTYQASLEHIRKRRPLSDNPGLTLISFTRSSLEPHVETVSLLRAERERLAGMGFSKAFENELRAVYTKAEKELREDLEILLRSGQQADATRLLEMNDQIQLVEYLSGLDAYRIRQGYEKDDYQAVTAEQGDYKTLFWPVRDDEYWNDELRNYRVLANDRCSGKSPK